MNQYPFGDGYREMKEGDIFSYSYPGIKMETNQFINPPHYVHTESYNTSASTSATINNNTSFAETMIVEELAQQQSLVKNEVESFYPVGRITVKDWSEHVDQENKRGRLTDYDICKTVSSPFVGFRPKPLGETYFPDSPIPAGTSSGTAQSFRQKPLGETYFPDSPISAGTSSGTAQSFRPKPLGEIYFPDSPISAGTSSGTSGTSQFSEANYCNDMVALRNFKFNLSNPTKSVYRALNLWTSIIHGNSERESVDAVIGCIDNEQLRGYLLARKCSNIPELISVLTTITNMDKSSYTPPTKRTRRDVEMTWHSPDRPERPEWNFNEVCQDEEFLKLTPQELICLIRKDELNVREEREVYNAVLSWVKFDEDRRYPRMEHILQAVRCQYLTPSFLKEQMSTCSVLQKVPACREYLAKIFQDLTLHKKPIVKERRPNTPRIIYVAGGYFRHSIDVFEAFNLDDNCWTTLSRLTVPRSGLGAAFLKGLFYAVGGRNTSPGSSYDSDWVDVYSPATEQWRPCSPMATPRHRVGVAVMDGLLYAVGGSANSEYHKTVECYDPEKDTWTYTASMGRARLGVGVAVVNRLLYAVGGFDGARRSASVESYHPENNKWTEVAPMKYARSGAGVAAWNQYIYVVGGYDGASQLASVERYDTERDVWEEVTPMKAARSALSLAVLDNKLYAMGGYDGTSFLDVVEIYDPSTDAWSGGTALPSARSGHASAVCYQHLPPHDLDTTRRHDDVMMPGVVELHAAAGRL